MKRFLGRGWGPLGPLRRLSGGVGPDDRGARWGYVTLDQRRAHRVFWLLFGVTLGVIALALGAVLGVPTVRQGTAFAGFVPAVVPWVRQRRAGIGLARSYRACRLGRSAEALRTGVPK